MGRRGPPSPPRQTFRVLVWQTSPHRQTKQRPLHPQAMRAAYNRFKKMIRIDVNELEDDGRGVQCSLHLTRDGFCLRYCLKQAIMIDNSNAKGR